MSAIPRARLLVIDNDPRVHNDLRRIFLDFDVHTVEGEGPKLLILAKERAEQVRPHVVVTDLRLFDDTTKSDRSGMDFLKQRPFSTAGTVLYSAFLDADLTHEAWKEVGVDDVVSKKKSPKLLVEAVTAIAKEM